MIHQTVKLSLAKGHRTLFRFLLLLFVSFSQSFAMIQVSHKWAGEAAIEYMLSDNATIQQRWVAEFLSTKVGGASKGIRIKRLKEIIGDGAQNVDFLEDTELTTSIAG